MSVFKYNGVTFPYAFHTDFKQEFLYDESNTDLMYSKFDITVQAILNADYVSIIDSTLAAGSEPATIMAAIRKKLMRPRKELSIKFNGVELLPPAQSGNRFASGSSGVGLIDAKNGPQPQSCVINVLTNTSFLVTYRIIAHYWDDQTVGNSVISNRWQESVVIDNCNYTTRTRTGKYFIRSDNAKAEVADKFRILMAVTGIPDGFKRESSTYTIAADGLAMSFVVVDKEVYRQPPKPAFVATGNYTESTTILGAMRWGKVEVSLKGSKDSDQAELMETCIAVAASKLRMAGAVVDDKGSFLYLEEGAFTVDLYENSVSCTMKCMMNTKVIKGADGKTRFEGVAGIDYKALTDHPFKSGPEAPHPKHTAYGTAVYLLKAAAYFDPSIRDVQVDQATAQLTKGKQVGEVGLQGE